MYDVMKAADTLGKLSAILCAKAGIPCELPDDATEETEPVEAVDATG